MSRLENTLEKALEAWKKELSDEVTDLEAREMGWLWQIKDPKRLYEFIKQIDVKNLDRAQKIMLLQRIVDHAVEDINEPTKEYKKIGKYYKKLARKLIKEDPRVMAGFADAMLILSDVFGTGASLIGEEKRRKFGKFLGYCSLIAGSIGLGAYMYENFANQGWVYDAYKAVESFLSRVLPWP